MSEENSVCLNCDNKFPSNFDFCPHCGQSSKEQDIRLKYFLADYAAAKLFLDSDFLLTLKLLFFKPDIIARDFIKGKRTTYIPPIRLFLRVSLLFLFVLAVISKIETFNNAPPIKEDKEFIHIDFNSEENVKDSVKVEGKEGWFKALVKQKIDVINTEIGEDALSKVIVKYIFSGMFFLIPLTAFLFFLLFYRNTYYIEHLLFVTYVQSSIFLYAMIFNIIELITSIDWLVFVELLWFVGLTILWVKRFYAISFVKTLWKLILFYLSYSILLLGYVFVIVLISILMV